MSYTFNGEVLTAETITATRKHFADSAEREIQDALSGAVFVNDTEKYVAWRTEARNGYLSGELDANFTFLQRAYWIQTGKMVALLP